MLAETWEGICQKSVALANLVKEAMASDERMRFDRVVVIPRGGYVPALIVAKRLGYSSQELLHFSVSSYEEETRKQSSHFRLGQLPTKKEVDGLKLLVIDDVCDTGETLQFVTSYLHNLGADKVCTGVLHYKPSQSTGGFKPDWFIAETDQWVTYPWEV